MDTDTPQQQQQSWADRTFEGGQKGLFGCLAVLGLLIALPLSYCASRGSDEGESASAEGQRDPADVALSEDIEAKLGGETNVRAMLKDGDSAEFRNEFISIISGGNRMLCGEVNSKNSLGAMAGFSRFIASPNPTAPSLIEGEGSIGSSPEAFAQAYQAACSQPIRQF